MDANKDGTVDKLEFVNTLVSLNITGISKDDYAFLYDQLDINQDGDLTFNEFTLYLEGATRTTFQKQHLSREVEDEIRQQIYELFRQIDTDGN